MFGAFGLKPGTVDGDILLNLDSEEEGIWFPDTAQARVNYNLMSKPGTIIFFKTIEKKVGMY